MAEQFIEPTRASRRNLVLLFVAALIIGVTTIELVEAWMAELNTRPICESVGPVWSLFTVACGGLGGCGLWQAWTGHKALKLGQWPLPGTWVWLRTPIHRGGAAKWRAYAIFSSGILIAGLSTVAWSFASTIVDSVESRCAAAASKA